MLASPSLLSLLWIFFITAEACHNSEHAHYAWSQRDYTDSKGNRMTDCRFGSCEMESYCFDWCPQGNCTAPPNCVEPETLERNCRCLTTCSTNQYGCPENGTTELFTIFANVDKCLTVHVSHTHAQLCFHMAYQKTKIASRLVDFATSALWCMEYSFSSCSFF